MTLPVMDWIWPSWRYQVGPRNREGSHNARAACKSATARKTCCARDGDVQVAPAGQPQGPRQIDRLDGLSGYELRPDLLIGRESGRRSRLGRCVGRGGKRRR